MNFKSLARLHVVATIGFPLALLACGEVSRDQPSERPMVGSGGASGNATGGASGNATGGASGNATGGTGEGSLDQEICGNVLRYDRIGLLPAESYGFRGTFDGVPTTLTDGSADPLTFALLLLQGKLVGVGIVFAMESGNFQGQISFPLPDMRACTLSASLLARPPVHDGTWGSYRGTGFLRSISDLPDDETGIARGNLHVEFRDVEDPSRAPHTLDGSFVLPIRVTR